MAFGRSRSNDERTGAQSELIVIGLANPGEQYADSRHNVGGDAVRYVAAERGITLSVESRQRAMSATITTPVGRITLAVPTTYMNESGAALVPLMRRVSQSEPSHIVVVHDELDFEPGRLQLKSGGGLAGHNGLRSIAGVLGSQDFYRLRIGIGKPAHKEQGADWVLKRLRGAALEEQRAHVSAAAAAINSIFDLGLDAAQQAINAAPRG